MEPGDVVKLHYVGRDAKTGEIFDLTDPDVADAEDVETQEELGPVKILLGDDQLIEGVEQAVMDMEEGDEQTIEVPTEKAFGSRDSDNIKTISEREFEQHDVTPRRGMPVEIDGQRGRVIMAMNGRVKVDFNHPMAGKDLEYDISVLETIEDTEGQARAVLDKHFEDQYDLSVDEQDITITFDADVPEDMGEAIEDQLTKLNAVENVTIEFEADE
ncbi:MAG: peptidylprolyl isomerase [Candidatus Nanohaloarchaeota archaeon QJJ-5]|nr:peptidylprolyl isomerase [Candidatus Nanohaloarchaeota archaeon QJJ-5]